ncbi:MAG: outer membrane beta-barrel protein [Acidobacteria bacterium]|nr:outer membrane beta-barrel protein [Acidobacteriota bacterium]
MCRIALLVLLMALAPLGGAMAATLEQDFPTVGTFKWGPFRVRPFFLLRATGYDSNVFLEDGTSTSDFTSSPELGIRLFSLFKNRGVVQVEEILDYVWYAHNDELSHFNNAFQARAAYYMKRGLVFAELRTLSLRERPSTEIDYRVRRHERYFGTGWRFVWPHSSLQFRLGRDSFDYESGVEAGQGIPVALNRLEKVITITGSKRILPKTDFLMEWEGRRIDFDTEPLIPTEDDDSSSRRFSVGFLFDTSAFIKGSLKVGVLRLEPDSRAVEGYDGPVGEAVLLYRLTGLTTLEMRGQRQALFTTALNNVYLLDQGYGATLTQAVSARVAAEIGIDREKVSFPNETTTCITVGENEFECETGLRTDWIRSFFGGAYFRLSNLSRIGLRVGQWERDSTFEFLNRHRIIVQMTYSYNF